MGGYGSGRWYRWDTRTTMDAVHCIDVRYMRRQGSLQPGSWGALAWQRGGQQTSWIEFATAADHLVLRYRYRAHGGAWESVEETVWLDRTPCHYGVHGLGFAARTASGVSGCSVGRRSGSCVATATACLM